MRSRRMGATFELPLPRGGVDYPPFQLRPLPVTYPVPQQPVIGPVYPVAPPPYTVQNPSASLTVGAIPPGSYQLSSRNISVDGNGYLYAECERINGTWVQSPPLYYLDCVGDITNIDGTLICAHTGTVLPPTPFPQPTPAPIPTSGPLPPGAGYQQVEQPGSPYPYVYIGTGQPQAPYSYFPYGTYGGATPWSIYQSYAAGDQATYGGATWIALAPSIGMPPSQYGGYWSMSGGSPYASPFGGSPYGSFGGSPATAARALLPSGGSSFSSLFNQYKWWILGGLAAVVVVPRLLPRR